VGFLGPLRRATRDLASLRTTEEIEAGIQLFSDRGRYYDGFD